jgi:hypothetical protein
MKLTKLQVEIFEYRLEVPCAMSEVLAEEMGLSFEEASELVEQYAPGLIEKIEGGESLNPIEKSLAMDIATENVFADIAYECIGFGWPCDSSPQVMTPLWHSRIVASKDSLNEKIEKACK